MGIQPFRFWCQHVLPAVYEDSLSYYELLCKVVAKLNETIGVANATSEGVEQLTNFVNNYFANLNVQTEINNKLDEMAESGELQQILSMITNNFTYPELFGAVGDGVTDDTNSFYSAIATKKIIVLDGNKTYNLNNLYEFSNCMIVGNKTTIVIGQNVILNGCKIKDCRIDVNGHNMVAKNNVVLSDCECFNGDLCLVAHTDGSTNVKISGCIFHSNTECDVYTAYNTHEWLIEQCRVVSECDSHNIRLGQAYNCVIRNNTVQGSKNGFGIVLGESKSCIITDNFVRNTYLEAINIHDTDNTIIANNICTWDDYHGGDFGISIYGQNTHSNYNLVKGNNIYNSAKAGFNIERSCSFNVFTDNIVQNPCRKYNEEDRDATSCCVLIRSEEVAGGCNRNVVKDNSFYYDRENIEATVRDTVNGYQNIIVGNTAVNFTTDINENNQDVVANNNFIA